MPDSVLTIAKVPTGRGPNEWRYAPLKKQPRAVILDPKCRAPLNKMFYRLSKNQTPSPWTLCGEDIPNLGKCHIPMKVYDDGKFKWEEILSTLSVKGVNLAMIEGGGVVINDVLAHRIADVIIVFISPVFIGRGVQVHPELPSPEWLDDVQTIQLGQDMAFVGRMKTR